ncbi:50S ribosomal protein L32 [Propionibacterium sp.]|uniref:50S ribosomal protein L32 n=1 Tax=Propionibacterium sp. TaxID=1977903 RepID=UPI0039EA1500
MAVPKRKMSRSNTRSRRSQWKAAPVTLVACSFCGNLHLPHTACPKCHRYGPRGDFREVTGSLNTSEFE